MTATRPLRIAELTFEEFLGARSLWDDALRRSPDNHVFLTWEWLSRWWRHYGGGRRFLLVTVVDGEKIIAAAPLMSSRYKLLGLGIRKIEFIGTPASDYHSFLLTKKEIECGKMMIRYADRAAMRWDCFELSEIPEDSQTAGVLRTLSGSSSRFEERTLSLCPYVSLPTNFEDCLQRLSPSFRKNLLRYERKLEREFKVGFEVHNDIETISSAMKILFDLHGKRWQSKKQAGAFGEKKFRDFHLDVGRAFAERGWLALNFLTLDGEPVAAGYDFKYGQKLFYYLSGFDPEFSKYNIGHLRHMYLMRYCIENGLGEYDFLRGDEPYKLRWNTFLRRNLEIRAKKRRIIPVLYDLATKNEQLYPLTYRLGKRLTIG